MKGDKSYSRLYGVDSADQSSSEGDQLNYMKFLISPVRPLKGCFPVSVGLWNERMTISVTVDEGVKSYSRLYGEDSADQSSTEGNPPNYMKFLISPVRPLKGCFPVSVGLWNERMTNSVTVDEGSQKLFSVIWGRFCRPVVLGR